MSEPTEREEAEVESACAKPCHPDSGCGECADYWQRMIREGFWDMGRKRWTERGMREMRK